MFTTLSANKRRLLAALFTIEPAPETSQTISRPQQPAIQPHPATRAMPNPSRPAIPRIHPSPFRHAFRAPPIHDRPSANATKSFLAELYIPPAIRTFRIRPPPSAPTNH